MFVKEKTDISIFFVNIRVDKINRIVYYDI